MDLIIRQERLSDRKAVESLVFKAFKRDENSIEREDFLVSRLRRSSGFVPALSIVAESGEDIIGHILLTKVSVHSSSGESEPSLAMAPVSVHPDRQGNGVGKLLIEYSHRVSAAMNFGSIIVLGHASYYPKFGYVPASRWGISCPFPVPDESFMAIELYEGALAGVEGQVVYPKPFFDQGP